VCAALKVRIAGSTDAPALTRNLSESGLFLMTRQRWPEGTVLNLTLHHRFFDLVVFARVVRQQRDGVGFALIEPSAEQRAQLRQIIDSLLADGAWYDDRRRGVRTELRGPLVWRLGATEHQSELRDLGPGGAFIGTSEPPEVGAQVLVYLPAVGGEAPAPTQEVLGCQATVVHRSAEGFGVAFVFPSTEFLASIDRLSRAAGL
jgi:hypothetical protein